MSIIIFFTVTFLSWVFLYLKEKHEYWKNLDVPFPKPTFFFGNVGRIFTLRTSLGDILKKIYRDHKAYPYVGFYNFWKPAILIRDPELVKNVLVKHFNNFQNNWVEADISVDPLIGYNPFVLKEEQWRSVRSELTPQFTGSKIKLMYSQIEEKAKLMTKFIKSKMAEEIEVRDLTARFTGDNVMSCAYGLNGNSFGVETPSTFIVGSDVAAHSKAIQIKQTIGLMFPLLRKIFKATFLGNPVPSIFKTMILEAIDYREKNHDFRNDFLNFIMDIKKSSGDGVEDDYIIAHAFTFFLDGFETSSLAMAYTLLELSLHPEVQEEARREIKNVLEKHNHKITHAALLEMTYLDNVISESLRKTPPIKILSRVCTKEFYFPHPKDNTKEVRVEKGTEIFISVESIQRDPEYYPNPEDFNPHNFDEELKNNRPKCTYLGFGEGPRLCLGRKFALAQLKLGLINILSDFELEISKNTNLPIEQEVLHLFNGPKNPIFLYFRQVS